MKIVIVGAGQVGFNIASRLVEEHHDVVLVERDETILARATDSLDIQGLRGHGARPEVLEEAGIASADMLVAVTDVDEVNMVACLMAAILGPKEIIKIARVRDPSYLDPRVFADPRVAIDLAINPEQRTADKILSVLRYPAVTEVVDFADGKVKLLGLRVEDTSPLAGMRFLDLPERFSTVDLLIAAIHRGDEVIIPRGHDVILPGDEVYLVSTAERTDSLLRAVGVPVVPVTRVMLAGGSKINRFVAKELEARGVKPKLIEPDPRLARWISDELTETVVLRGSPTDADLLRQENINEMQAFVAAGNDEEVNVMSALLARRMGAKRVIATTNRADYIPVMKGIGIDVCISPRLIAVGSILHFIRQGRVVAARSLGEADNAEALEYEAHLTSEVVGRPLHALRLPRGALVAAILRDDVAIIPTGLTVIEAGDHVIFVALRSAVSRIEKMLVRSSERD